MQTYLQTARQAGFNSRRLSTALGLLALLGCATASAQESPSYITPNDGRQGTFKAVQGEVTLIRADVRRAAVVGGGFSNADRLITGEGSATSMTLEDGTVLAVGPNSAVDLEQFTFDPTTQEGNLAVRLVRGSLRMITGLIAKLTPERVNVLTPTSVIGVRGTDFIVEAE